MTANTQKLVRVVANPTGPTGAKIKGVHILPTFTGPTGTFAQWGQINPTQQAGGPTGTFETVWAMSGGTGIAGEVKTVIIPGYTGPA